MNSVPVAVRASAPSSLRVGVEEVEAHERLPQPEPQDDADQDDRRQQQLGRAVVGAREVRRVERQQREREHLRDGVGELVRRAGAQQPSEVARHRARDASVKPRNDRPRRRPRMALRQHPLLARRRRRAGGARRARRASRPGCACCCCRAALEQFILRDQAEDLLTAPGRRGRRARADPVRGATCGCRRRSADGLAATQARRLKLPGRAARDRDLPPAAVPARPRPDRPAPGRRALVLALGPLRGRLRRLRAPAGAAGGAAPGRLAARGGDGRGLRRARRARARGGLGAGARPARRRLLPRAGPGRDGRGGLARPSRAPHGLEAAARGGRADAGADPAADRRLARAGVGPRPGLPGAARARPTSSGSAAAPTRRPRG